MEEKEIYVAVKIDRFLLCMTTAIFVATSSPTTFANDMLDFNRDIQPLLADRCYPCHGPDEHSRKAGLRLDRQDSAHGTSEQGAAIVPGKPKLSELVRRIHAADESEIMPPPELNKPLKPDEKAILMRWIAEGAIYQKHWSLVPPRRPQPPVANLEDSFKSPSPDHPVDRFVRKKWQQQDLPASPPANRETLIRRLTLDLTGLPPSPQQIDAFLKDSRPDAYDQLVEQLMSTTAYAERRAQDWLDLARYADTRGFADDKTRDIWPYRDWVVQAIDRNMPFDQFTVLQLAGDLLPNATDQQRLATAFHRNAPQAKGVTYQTEEYRIKGVIDRVNTIGRVWFGLTLECAQCHDHKFDPITQRDYYSLFALFNNIEHRGSGHGQGGPTMEYTIGSNQNGKSSDDRLKLETELATAKGLLPPAPKMDAKYVIGHWNKHSVAQDSNQYSLTGDLTIAAKIRTEATVANIASKYDWRGQQRSYAFGVGGEGDTGSRPGHLYFWVSSKTHPFTGATVYGSQPVNDGIEHRVVVEFVAGKSIRLIVDGIEDQAAQITGSIPASIAKSNRRLAIGAGYQGTNEPNAYRFEGELSEIQLSDQAIADSILHGDAAKRVNKLQAVLQKLDRQQTRQVVAKVPIMRERLEPRETFVHLRGNFLTVGDPVSPAVPKVFAVTNRQQPRNRLEFARWLVNGNNPLVARVVVNRIWQNYFGRGFVSTVDDFGAQGKPPTHPKLLDWLAVELVESGWNMKHLHRLIVTSATYQQSGKITTAARRTDPENLLLSYMPRTRLPAEQIRDQALAISGLLVHKVGGPPVFPTHPENYWQQRALPGQWSDSEGDARYRKSMYTYWRRMALHPTLELLNAPARENCVTQRTIANVPTQALVLMNDPIFHEASTAFAARLLREEGQDERQRLELAFRLALGRSPSSAERDHFSNFIAEQNHHINMTASNQKDIWNLVCSVLLNLDETITRP